MVCLGSIASANEFLEKLTRGITRFREPWQEFHRRSLMFICQSRLFVAKSSGKKRSVEGFAKVMAELGLVVKKGKSTQA